MRYAFDIPGYQRFVFDMKFVSNSCLKFFYFNSFVIAAMEKGRERDRDGGSGSGSDRNAAAAIMAAAAAAGLPAGLDPASAAALYGK